jgi:predicted dehydrogenase
VRAAVIGVGYLGRFHAQKYASLPAVDLIGVVDISETTAKSVAQELATDFFTDYHRLLDKVDAVSIVVPTQKHFETAMEFLERGVHVLLEKPMTTTVAEAEELNKIAQAQKVVLQIGHLERFNPAILALADELQNPLFIESHRVAPFNPRGADVNVVLDLMIHDIDIILDIVKSPLTSIDVSGVPVLSNDIDIANARLRFASGCVANVTASRAGMKSERKMRVFQHDAYLTVDFQNKSLGVHRKGENATQAGVPEIISDTRVFEAGDALKAEIISFVDAIRNHSQPIVSGEDGLRALDAAIQITELLENAGI